MKFVGNSFSLNMLETGKGKRFDLSIMRIPSELAKKDLSSDEYYSAMGHEDIVRLVNEELGVNLKFNRESIKLRQNDEIIVCQYSGPRLSPGTTKLPKNAQIDYYWIKVL